jgi:hypothetical protein
VPFRTSGNQADAARRADVLKTSGRRSPFTTLVVVLAVLASLFPTTGPGAVASATTTIGETPNVSGSWVMANKWTLNGGVAGDTTVLKETSPGVYTAEHASDPGSITTDVPISEGSFYYWSCDSVGIYNQSNESSCPSGWFSETWNLDLSKIPYTAKGTFEGYNVQGTLLAAGTFTAYLASGPASVAVSISPPSSTVAIGEKVSVTVTVKAGPRNLTSLTLSNGLNLSPKGIAVVSQAPPGLSGFALAAFASRKFVFGLMGAKAGTVEIKAFAYESDAPSHVHGSAYARLSVGDISDYTINMQASIPQDIVVDPSTAAHFNTTADNGPEGFPKESTISQVGQVVKTLALLGKEPEFPECLPVAEVAEDTEKHMESEWYSYYVGATSLGKVSVPLQWDETTQQVTLEDSLSFTTYDLTRVFKYRLGHVVLVPRGKFLIRTVVYDTQVEECTEKVPVKMLVAPVAGGDGLEVGTGTPDDAFTIVAAWEFPFAPLGVAVNPEPGFWERFEKKYGPSLDKVFGEGFYAKYKPYLSTTLWSIVFGVTLLIESGGLAALLKAPALLEKLLTFTRAAQMPAKLISQLKEFAAIAHVAGEAGEYAHTASTTRELIEELFQILGFMEVESGPYPVMSAVIRGKFTTEYGHGTPYATLLGVSVRTTKFPNFWLTVSRKTQPASAGSTVQPFNGVLPWPEHVGAEPVSTHNPFAANPAGLVNDSQNNHRSYNSGEADVENVIGDTSQLPAVTKSIRDDANLDSGFGAEQAEAPDPACDADGEATDDSTICWLIEDGSGPNDHRA